MNSLKRGAMGGRRGRGGELRGWGEGGKREGGIGGCFGLRKGKRRGAKEG
jgi:hypothetical protein